MNNVAIAFTAEMASLILAGKKTATRRPVTYKHEFKSLKQGDRITVLEPWRILSMIQDTSELLIGFKDEDSVWRSLNKYAGSESRWERLHREHGVDMRRGVVKRDVYGNFGTPYNRPHPARWREPADMPPWASRMQAEVTSIKKEPIKSMKKEDWLAEGFKTKKAFVEYWDWIYSEVFPFEDNPEVYVIDFVLIDTPALYE